MHAGSVLAAATSDVSVTDIVRMLRIVAVPLISPSTWHEPWSLWRKSHGGSASLAAHKPSPYVYATFSAPIRLSRSTPGHANLSSTIPLLVQRASQKNDRGRNGNAK